MRGILNLEVDGAELARIADDLQATDAQAGKALFSTLNKMASWLRAESVRRLARHLKLPARIARRRLFRFALRRRGNGGEVVVFYGLNPIALVYMTARQTKTGVTAGAHKRKGAFIAQGRGKNQQVFKRRGKARLPLDKQTLEIYDEAQVFIEDNLLGTDEFDRKFLGFYEHEIKWRTRTQK